jgi:hypothetical protein
MKSRFLNCITATALLVALAIPVSLAAQEQQSNRTPTSLQALIGGGQFKSQRGRHRALIIVLGFQ